MTRQVSETVQNPPEKQPAPVRLLEVDLSTGSARTMRFESEWPELESLAEAGGSALAWSLQADAHRSGASAPFVLAVGAAVKRGAPTAARVSVCGRGAHTGKIAEGAVGGSLGRRLASITDALVLRGRCEKPGVVLVIDAAGSARFESYEERESLPAWLESLALKHPRGAHLAVGPAAWRGVSFANLAAGEDPPSFVGRGGLGGALAEMGVWAIVVEADEVHSSEDSAELAAQLKRSPRLRERGAGGSLERAHEVGLHALDERAELGARALAQAGAEDGVGLRGCAGCPTPCGWIFETHQGARQGGRFNALDSVGLSLGLRSPTEALELLAACDEVGVDAKEAGAALEVLIRAHEEGSIESGPRSGVLEDFIREVRSLGQLAPHEAALGAGAIGLAERYGLEARTARGEAARPRQGLGGALAAQVAGRGAEPMRTFAFLLEGGVPLARAQALLQPLKISARGLEASDLAEKGRLVWWHENFVAGVDATGFCAFSAAGVLADGVMELDELAAQLLMGVGPEGAAKELLSVGASVTLLSLEVTGGTDKAELEARGLEQPWEEYRRLRGLDEEGRVLAEVGSKVGSAEVLRWEQQLKTAAAVERHESGERALGHVRFAAGGELGRALGGAVSLELELPQPLSDALLLLCDGRSQARELLFVNDAAIAVAWRGGERVDLDELVRDGDQLDLVLAVGGG